MLFDSWPVGLSCHGLNPPRQKVKRREPTNIVSAAVMFIVAHKPYNKTAISTSVGTGYTWFDVMLCSEVEGGLGGEQANKRLRLFVPAAAELSRQREATQLGPKHQLSMVRAALRLGRQVHAFPTPTPPLRGPPPCPLLAPLHPSDALCHPVVSHAKSTVSQSP